MVLRDHEFALYDFTSLTLFSTTCHGNSILLLTLYVDSSKTIATQKMSLETTEPTVVPEVPTEEVSEVKNKHKLCRAWQLWLLCPVKEAGKKNQKAKPADSLIYDISTVEDFWAIFNNFKSPAEIAFLSERTNIILSAQEVQPKWEDPANLPGGAWSVSYSFPTSPASAPNPLVPGEHTIDKMWDATLLSVIGGTMKVRFFLDFV